MLAPDGSRKKVIITDETQKRILEASLSLIQRVDAMIADAVVLDWFKIIKHMNADEAMEFAKN